MNALYHIVAGINWKHLAVAFLLLLLPVAASATVLLVGLDGADHRIVSQLDLPNLRRIGEVRELRIVDRTETKPSWGTILSPGLPSYVHGTTSNKQFKAIPLGWTVFERLHERGVSVSYVSEKCNPRVNAGNLCLGAINGHKYPFYNIAPILTYQSAADQPSSEAQMTKCIEAARVSQFTFCHFAEPDRTGHLQGGDSPEYRARLIELDAQLGRLLDENVRVVVVSDHGFEIVGNPEDIPLQYRNVGKPFGRHHWAEPHAIAVGLPENVKTGRDVGPWILEQFN